MTALIKWEEVKKDQNRNPCGGDRGPLQASMEGFLEETRLYLNLERATDVGQMKTAGTAPAQAYRLALLEPSEKQ